MLSIAKSIKKDVCRECPITENDRSSFATIAHIQRYNPMLDLFRHPEQVQNKANLELPSKFQVSEWHEEFKPNFWKAVRTVNGATESCEVYTKIIHLVNPIDALRKNYAVPSHPFVPQINRQMHEIMQKVYSQYNQAYVDYLTNYVLSRFRELDLTPHCVLFYGSFTGISSKYKFNISNEYDTYRQCRWFWDSIKEKRASIVVNKEVSEELYNDIITPPFEDDEELELTVDDVSSVGSAKSVSFDEIDEDTDDNEIKEVKLPSDGVPSDGVPSDEVPSDGVPSDEVFSDGVQSDDPPDPVLELEEFDDINSEDSEKSSISSESDKYSDDSYTDDEDEDEDEDDIEISLELSNIPVITIAQEAQEGIMDSLLDDDEIDGAEHGSAEWEQRWIAWLFQIISVLTFLQSSIHFTHNDLHSNNILWRSTDKPYLYYSMKDGTTWRVPTYGKIFSIIDFGRAIFRLGKRNFISDDYWPDQDASDQYNFGPFYDPKKPKVVPNMSFDLCRLSVSLIDGLFDEIPPKKKGKKILSQEGSWKVYETKSELYNLLWSWTVDDAGRTIYINKDGNEKYEGFDLYIRIAQDVHSAVPREQLMKPIFKSFLFKGLTDDKVYSLGI